MAATLSLLANLASIASLLVGDVPAASENIRKLAKSYGPGGHLGELLVELSFIHNTITANSRYLERAVVDTLYANLERLDQRSEIAQADWEAASLKKRFCTHFQTRKAHKELHEDVMDLGGIVRATSKAAQRKRGRGVAGTGIIPEANLHTTHQMEQDISTALPLMLDPTLTHSTGIWTTSPVDIGAQNPFADGVSVQ